MLTDWTFNLQTLAKATALGVTSGELNPMKQEFNVAFCKDQLARAITLADLGALKVLFLVFSSWTCHG